MYILRQLGWGQAEPFVYGPVRSLAITGKVTLAVEDKDFMEWAEASALVQDLRHSGADAVILSWSSDALILSCSHATEARGVSPPS